MGIVMNIFDFIISAMASSIFIQVLSLLMLGMMLTYLIKTRKHRVKINKEITELRQDVRALAAAALGVGERILKVERQQRQDIPTLNSVASLSKNNENSYEQAINLVQKGAGTDTLVDTCGLSEGEADLVSLLHKINDVAEKNSAAVLAQTQSYVI